MKSWALRGLLCTFDQGRNIPFVTLTPTPALRPSRTRWGLGSTPSRGLRVGVSRAGGIPCEDWE